MNKIQNVFLTDTVTTRGARVVGDEGEVAQTSLTAGDKRNTMPRGGYRFGASNPALRPIVPAGE